MRDTRHADDDLLAALRRGVDPADRRLATLLAPLRVEAHSAAPPASPALAAFLSRGAVDVADREPVTLVEIGPVAQPRPARPRRRGLVAVRLALGTAAAAVVVAVAAAAGVLPGDDRVVVTPADHGSHVSPAPTVPDGTTLDGTTLDDPRDDGPAGRGPAVHDKQGPGSVTPPSRQDHRRSSTGVTTGTSGPQAPSPTGGRVTGGGADDESAPGRSDPGDGADGDGGNATAPAAGEGDGDGGDADSGDTSDAEPPDADPADPDPADADPDVNGGDAADGDATSTGAPTD